MASFVGVGCAPDPPSSVVGFVIDSCDPGEEVGSGMIIKPGIAITSAHVVAGAHAITVLHQGRRVDGAIVGFDPEMDLALIEFDGHANALPIGSEHVERGDDAVVYAVRDGEVVVLPATIRRRVRIRTEDIYIQGETVKPGFELDADIESGDSGGAVVVDGRIVGVVWARSRRYESRGYAIDPERAGDLINRQFASGDLGDDVDITRCH